MTDEDLTPGLTADGSRRDFIRRSAVVGGALVWAVPTVQAIGPRAFAQDGSPGTPEEPVCNRWYAIKIDFDSQTGEITQITTFNPNTGVGGGTNCFAGGTWPQTWQTSGGQAFVESNTVTFLPNGQVSVLLSGVTSNHVAFSKCGSTACQPATVDDNNAPEEDVVVFAPCAGAGPRGQDLDISNLQIIFCAP